MVKRKQPEQQPKAAPLSSSTTITNSDENKVQKPHKTRKNKHTNHYKSQVSQYFDVVNQEAKKKERDAPGLSFFSKCLLSSSSSSLVVKKLKKGEKPTVEQAWKNQQLRQLGWGSDTFSDRPLSSVTRVCHCELCELKSVVAQNAKKCSTFVLLDLDNWGWKDWSSGNRRRQHVHKNDDNQNGQNVHQENRTELQQSLSSLNGVFCWAFHGGGFERYLPSEQDKEQFQKWNMQIEKMNESNSRKKSSLPQKSEKSLHDQDEQQCVFEHFMQRNALRFSPSGWSDQSADLAIRKMSKLLLQKVNVCVVTRDEDLRVECERNHGKPDEEVSTTTNKKKFLCIRPNVVGYNNVMSHLKQFVADVNKET